MLLFRSPSRKAGYHAGLWALALAVVGLLAFGIRPDVVMGQAASSDSSQLHTMNTFTAQAVQPDPGSTIRLAWTAPASGASTVRGYQMRIYAAGHGQSWVGVDRTRTEYTFTGLSANTEYRFKMRVQNNAGDYGPWSNRVKASTGPPNQSPAFGKETYTMSIAENVMDAYSEGLITVTDPDHSNVSITITDGAAGKFTVNQQGDITYFGDGEDYESFTDPTEAYTIKLKATDPAGASDTATLTVAVTNVVESSPARVSRPTQSAARYTTKVSVSWTALAGHTTGYGYRYRVAGSGTTTWSTGSAAGSTATISDLKPGTKYLVQVRAVDPTVDSPGKWSKRLAARTANRPPKPQNVGTRNPQLNQMRIVWDAAGAWNNTALSGYEVDYRKSGTTAYQRVDVGASKTNTVIKGLDLGATYEVRVRTTYGTDSSKWSTLTVETGRLPGAPTAFTAVSKPTGFAASWQAPTDAGNPAVTGYQYAIREDYIFDNWQAWSTASAATTQRITGLLGYTRYSIRVRAVNALGAGPAVQITQRTAVNQRPVFNTPPAFSVSEGTPGDIALGSVTATDPESDSLTYDIGCIGLISPGPLSTRKFYVTTAGELRTYSHATFDYETKSSHIARVYADDGHSGTRIPNGNYRKCGWLDVTVSVKAPTASSSTD